MAAITRAYTLIYTLSLLTMLTRIQLNLLGRRSYLSSVVSLATGSAQATISLENNDDDNAEQAYGSDFEVNRKYLTFSWWLLNRGWVDIMQRVEAAVREVFGDLSPRDTLTLETFSTLTSQVRRLVEGGSPGGGRAGTQWLPFLLPPPDMEELVLRESGVMDDDNDNDNSASRPQQQQPTLADGFTSAAASATCAASLRRLLDETADLAESPSFAHVHAQLLDAAFSLLLRGKLAQGAFEASAPVTAGDSSSPAHASTSSKAVLLPKVLSVLTRQAHAIGNGMPNEYLREMEAVRDLEGFAAVVYSSNWESEIARDDDVGAGAGTGLGRAAAAAAATSSVGAGEESLVVVDPTQNFESAWERAAG